MKKILFLLLLSFFINLNAQAEDIKNFQIEGISLGDSSLSHFSQKEIKKFTKKYKYYNKDFIPVEPKMPLNTYDSIQFYYKNNDTKKPIHVITGTQWFPNDIEACYKEKKVVIEELKNIFPNAKQVDLGIKKHDFDKSGKSTKSNYRFVFKNGDYAVVACYDWSKKLQNKKNFKDHLRVGLVKKDFDHWIYNIANK